MLSKSLFILLILIQFVNSINSTVKSEYSNSLSLNSPLFIRPYGRSSDYYFYDILQLTILTRGTYSLESNSSMHTYGCLYENSFDLQNIYKNLLICNENSVGNKQFLINNSLESNIEYILVVTTYNYLTTGNYSIIANGPLVILINLINPTTYSSSITSTTSSSSSRTTWLSGHLYENSPTYARPGTTIPNYYYESIEIVVYSSDIYRFRSNSSMHTYGCLYKISFDSLFPLQNKIICDDGGKTDGQFQIDSQIELGVVYILVVTSFYDSIRGNYSISAIGPQSISMKTYQIVETTYNGYLSSTDARYSPSISYSSNSFYYKAIELRVNVTDGYIIKSRSSMSTYGCLYQRSFHPSNPLDNSITCDYNSGENFQFLIRQILISGEKYILVVSTTIPYSTGSYSIIITGSSLVNTMLITSIDDSLSTIAIILLSLSCCLIFTIIVLTILFCKRKFQIDSKNQLIVFPKQRTNISKK